MPQRGTAYLESFATTVENSCRTTPNLSPRRLHRDWYARLVEQAHWSGSVVTKSTGSCQRHLNLGSGPLSVTAPPSRRVSFGQDLDSAGDDRSGVLRTVVTCASFFRTWRVSTSIWSMRLQVESVFVRRRCRLRRAVRRTVFRRSGSTVGTNERSLIRLQLADRVTSSCRCVGFCARTPAVAGAHLSSRSTD